MKTGRYFLIYFTAFLGQLCAPSEFYDERNGTSMEFDFESTPDVVDTNRITVVKEPTYLLLVQRSISPDDVFRFIVNLIQPSQPLIIKATLLVNSIEMDLDEKRCDTTEPQTMQLKVGSLTSSSNCKLKVEASHLDGLTGSAFIEEINLQFKPKKLSLLVETDQNLYQPGDQVKMRITTINKSMKLSRERFNVTIFTPKGTIIAKWLSKQCMFGSVYLSLLLSPYAAEGSWTIEVKSKYFDTKKHFIVEDFKEELFEVTVETPPYISADDEFIRGLVYASYPSGAMVKGNLSLRMGLRLTDNSQFSLYVPDSDLYQGFRKFTGEFPFKLKMANFDYLMTTSEAAEVLMSATVSNSITSVTSYCSSKIFSTKIRLKFLNKTPFVFQPSMSLKYYISASLIDGSAVPVNRLIHHRLTVTPEVKFKSGVTRQLLSRSINKVPGMDAIWTGKIDLGNELGNEDSEWDVAMLNLPAVLKDTFGHKSYSSVIAVPHYAPEEKCLQITTSTKTSKVGEYTIFHVETNFYLEKFRFVVLNNDQILMSGEEIMEALLKTFPVAMTEDMIGTTTVLVYTTPRGGNLITDAISFHVEFNNSVYLNANIRRNNGLMASIELQGQPGIRVGLSGLILEKSFIVDWNDAREINNLETHMANHSLPTHKWLMHNGEQEAIHFPTEVIAIDANLTLRSVDLFGITDGTLSTRKTRCAESRGFYPCLSGGGCFTVDHKCDGKTDCPDGVDERNCHQVNTSDEDIFSFISSRRSRNKRDFKSSWMFRDSRISPEGQIRLDFQLPQKQSNLTLSYHAFDENSNIFTFSKPITVETSQEYWLQIDGPNHVGLQENVEFRVAVRNDLNTSVKAYICAAHSPSYTASPMKKRKNGKLFSPSTYFSRPVKRGSEKTKGVLVKVPPAGVEIVEFFVTFLKRDLSILKFEANLGTRKIGESINVYVEPSGFVQRHHTSLVVDLTSSPYHFGFMDIIIPANRIPGSEKVEASIFVDYLGHNNYNSGLPTSLGLPKVGCEYIMFNVLIDMLSRKQREHRSTRPSNDVKFGEVIRDSVQSLIFFQNADGGFRHFRIPSTSSVWLTCFVLRTFSEASASFPNTVYIDEQVIEKAIRFVQLHQESHGAFWEPSGAVGVRYLESYPSYNLNEATTKGLNLSLTAFCLTQLATLRQPYRNNKFNITLTSGQRWLEENLFLVELASPAVEVALITLVLQTMNSMKKELAFTILARNSRQEGSNLLYWGNDKYPGSNLKIVNQRSHLQPRYRQSHESDNIVATACALQVYSLRREVHAGKIAKWLNEQRSYGSGWVAGLDTFLAKEALQTHSLGNGMLQKTQISVRIEPMEGLSSPESTVFNVNNMYETKKYKLPPNPDVLRVQVKGHGQTVVQLSSEYSVEDPDLLVPLPTRAFNIKAEAKFTTSNVTSMDSRICVSWNSKNILGHSGIVVLQMGLPTGFVVFYDDLRKLLKRRNLSNLKEATFRHRRITFVLSKVTPSDTCLEFSAFQIYRVGNTSNVLPVKVFNYHSSETYTTTTVKLPPQRMKSCQQCSSMRCPDCPFLSYYSSSNSNRPAACIGVFLVLVIIFVSQTIKLFRSHL